MDITERVNLICRHPVQEVVTREELEELLKTKEHPTHYIGLEISGFLHIGTLLSTGYKINDFLKAGLDCEVFLADWHSVINGKMGGSMEDISRVSKYYEKAFETVCPGVRIRRGSERYKEKSEYWEELLKFAGHMPLARTKRSMTIMGRSADDEDVTLGAFFYPAMQAVDMHLLDVDIAHAGMDQRRIHMLARDIFPKMGWKVPIAIHHRLLPSLLGPDEPKAGKWDEVKKMSKSSPDSGIFMQEDAESITSKIRKAWCEPGNTETALLEILRQIIFTNEKEVTIERPEKYGGNMTYTKYEEMEEAFSAKKIHPMDLKETVSRYLVPIITDIGKKVPIDDEVVDIIRKHHLS